MDPYSELLHMVSGLESIHNRHARAQNGRGSGLVVRSLVAAPTHLDHELSRPSTTMRPRVER
jgi:hypothetical protein